MKVKAGDFVNCKSHFLHTPLGVHNYSGRVVRLEKDGIVLRQTLMCYGKKMDIFFKFDEILQTF